MKVILFLSIALNIILLVPVLILFVFIYKANKSGKLELFKPTIQKYIKRNKTAEKDNKNEQSDSINTNDFLEFLQQETPKNSK